MFWASAAATPSAPISFVISTALVYPFMFYYLGFAAHGERLIDFRYIQRENVC